MNKAVEIIERFKAKHPYVWCFIAVLSAIGETKRALDTTRDAFEAIRQNHNA